MDATCSSLRDKIALVMNSCHTLIISTETKVFVCACLCIYVCVHMFVYVCVHVYVASEMCGCGWVMSLKTQGAVWGQAWDQNTTEVMIRINASLPIKTQDLSWCRSSILLGHFQTSFLYSVLLECTNRPICVRGNYMKQENLPPPHPIPALHHVEDHKTTLWSAQTCSCGDYCSGSFTMKNKSLHSSPVVLLPFAPSWSVELHGYRGTQMAGLNMISYCLSL